MVIGCPAFISFPCAPFVPTPVPACSSGKEHLDEALQQLDECKSGEVGSRWEDFLVFPTFSNCISIQLQHFFLAELEILRLNSLHIGLRSGHFLTVEHSSTRGTIVLGDLPVWLCLKIGYPGTPFHPLINHNFPHEIASLGVYHIFRRTQKHIDLVKLGYIYICIYIYVYIYTYTSPIVPPFYPDDIPIK